MQRTKQKRTPKGVLFFVWCIDLNEEGNPDGFPFKLSLPSEDKIKIKSEGGSNHRDKTKPLHREQKVLLFFYCFTEKEVIRVIEKLWKNLPPRYNRIVKMLWSAFTMFFIGFGIYLQIEADIGFPSWNALNQGFSIVFPITYGTASITIGLSIVVIDLLLKEPIGMGTIIDAVCVGLGCDFFSWLDPVPEMDSFVMKLIVFMVSLFILSIGQYMYMITGLSCGPRDAFTVAIGKRCKKISIGTVNNIISAVVLTISWAMGATIGIGTVLSVFGMGMVMDWTFKLCRFEPRNVKHEDILTTAKILIKNEE